MAAEFSLQDFALELSKAIALLGVVGLGFVLANAIVSTVVGLL